MAALQRNSLAALLVCLALGCSPYVRKPNWLHPGPLGPQRNDAILHDPYTLDDLGPAVVGGRPLEYAKPVPEVVRGRLLAPAPTTVPSM